MKNNNNIFYDTTQAQQLLLPAWNAVREADPLTKYYPDMCPEGSAEVGVDFFSNGNGNCNASMEYSAKTCNNGSSRRAMTSIFVEDSNNNNAPPSISTTTNSSPFAIWDIAFTLRCTKQKLRPVPDSSCRERIMNILKRRFAILMLQKAAGQALISSSSAAAAAATADGRNPTTSSYDNYDEEDLSITKNHLPNNNERKTRPRRPDPSLVEDLNTEILSLCGTLFTSPWIAGQYHQRTPPFSSSSSSSSFYYSPITFPSSPSLSHAPPPPPQLSKLLFLNRSNSSKSTLSGSTNNSSNGFGDFYGGGSSSSNSIGDLFFPDFNLLPLSPVQREDRPSSIASASSTTTTTTTKSCLKLKSLEVGYEWFALLQKSSPDSELRATLIDILVNPPSSRKQHYIPKNVSGFDQEDYDSDDDSDSATMRIPSQSGGRGDGLDWWQQDLTSPVPRLHNSEREGQAFETMIRDSILELQHVKQLRKRDGKLFESPSVMPSSDFKVCFEYPGVLKRDSFSKVSFKWSVESLADPSTSANNDESASPQLTESLLKIDSVKNKSVFIVPYSIAAEVTDMVDMTDENTSLYIQPMGYADPLVDPIISDVDAQASSPRPTSPRPISPRLADFLDLQPDFLAMDGDKKSTVCWALDLVAEGSSAVMGVGHKVFRTANLLLSFGRGIGL